MYFELISASLIRLWLFSISDLVEWLKVRPELTTPNTSWERVKEGLSLPFGYKQKGSYHGSTLLLFFAKQLEAINPQLHCIIFIVCDLLTAMFLHKFVKNVLFKEFSSETFCRQWKYCGFDVKQLKNETRNKIAHLVFMLYLFNPMTILTCVAQTTTIFNNLFLSCFLVQCVSGNLLATTFFLALSTYDTLYSVQLMSVVCITYSDSNQQKDAKTSLHSVIKCFLGFICWMILLIFTACAVGNSEDVFKHYEFIWNLSDQTPNIGVFWYFFTELFEHFEYFFLVIFQLNIIFYSLPLSLKLRSNPYLLAFALLALTSIFKSYPTLGDTTLWLSLVPMWSYTFMYLRDSLVTVFAIFTTLLLCPVMWFVWISANSGNANFYFAATLVFSVTQLYLLSDVLLSFLKWQHYLRNPSRTEKPELGIHPNLILVN